MIKMLKGGEDAVQLGGSEREAAQKDTGFVQGATEIFVWKPWEKIKYVL